MRRSGRSWAEHWAARFNEAGARSPGCARTLPSRPVSLTCFNEAGARSPGCAKPDCRGLPRLQHSFNEAGARSPGCARPNVYSPEVALPSFNEAGARSPGCAPPSTLSSRYERFVVASMRPGQEAPDAPPPMEGSQEAQPLSCFNEAGARSPGCAPPQLRKNYESHGQDLLQ